MNKMFYRPSRPKAEIFAEESKLLQNYCDFRQEIKVMHTNRYAEITLQTSLS